MQRVDLGPHHLHPRGWEVGVRQRFVVRERLVGLVVDRGGSRQSNLRIAIWPCVNRYGRSRGTWFLRLCVMGMFDGSCLVGLGKNNRAVRMRLNAARELLIVQ